MRHYDDSYTRMLLFNMQSGRCACCGQVIDYHSSQIVHIVPQRKWIIEKCGQETIHDIKTLHLVCSLFCNDKGHLESHRTMTGPISYSAMTGENNE